MNRKAVQAQRAWTAIFDHTRLYRARITSAAAAMILAIAWLDLRLAHTVALGFLYIIPLVLAAGFLPGWQVPLLALICSILREAGSPIAWSNDYLARIATVTAAFAGATLFVKVLVRNQQLALEHVQQLQAQQQLERQLRHSQRLEAVGRLAGGIAHDFNNLLSVIIGFGDLALQQIEEDSGLRSDLEELRKAALSAARLTRQLLEFSRHEMLKPQPVDLNALVGNLSKILRLLIGENIQLQFTLQPGLGFVKADPGTIEQVVVNLAMNSRDAMPAGGKLTIETADVEIDRIAPGLPPGIQPGRYVTLAVKDTGVGMERKVQEHLFEPFFTTKESGKGTGLGLSTAYGIVKQSGGEIWFISEPGVGTTFTLYLPRSAAAPETTATGARPNPLVNGPDSITRRSTRSMHRRETAQPAQIHIYGSRAGN